MKKRCLPHATLAFFLCCALFCGIVVHSVVSVSVVSAQVVHAYRKPSDADLQWLLGDVSVLLPTSGTSDIMQVGFQVPGNNQLVSHCEPCEPAHLPKQHLIPPAPQVIGHHTMTGIAPDIDGVVGIAPTVNDSARHVVQMANERLPPPSTLPTEPKVAVFALEPVVERLPIPNDTNFFETPHSLITQDLAMQDLTMQDMGEFRYKSTRKSFKQREAIFGVPDMIGGSAWFADYGVGGVGRGHFSQPNMLLSRPNVVEHFNADAKNRIWADYRHWNNAVSMDDGNNVKESRAVDQFSFGLEKRLLRRTSVELRVPLFAQFASHQTASRATAVELGNISAFLKQVLAKGSHWTISGGIGATLPTADDFRASDGTGRLNNKLYYLTSFLGVQWHPNKDLFGHFVLQADVPVGKNELVVYGSDQLKVEGQQMIRTGLALGHWMYRNDCSKRACRLGSVVEVDYAVVTKGTPQYGNTLGVSAVNARKSALSAAVGIPMMFGNLTCTNSVILPISGSDRAFSVGYNFSMVQQF